MNVANTFESNRRVSILPSQALLVDADDVLVEPCVLLAGMLASGRRYNNRDAAKSLRKPIALSHCVLGVHSPS